METADLTILVRRAQEHEPAAFDALVDLYADRLFGFLYRLTGSRPDAEDLLQELFVRVVRMLPKYQHTGSFEGWLFRIATNLARDWIRRARRTPPTVRLSGEQDGGEQGRDLSWDRVADLSGSAPDYRMDLTEQADALQQALAQLPTAEREVVMLRHFSEMSYAGIAKAMGTPLGTALARGHRGLGKLREIMGQTDDA